MPGNNVTDEMVRDYKSAFSAYMDEVARGLFKPPSPDVGFHASKFALEAALTYHVVVPREPTAEMIIAGCENNPTQWSDGTDDGFAADVANDVYRAMIAAAPPTPAKEVG